jgi:lipopolysaccharide export system protein LptA
MHPLRNDKTLFAQPAGTLPGLRAPFGWRAGALVVLNAVLLAPGALALPEDRQQTLTFEAVSSELLLDRGVYVYRGTPQQPAVATQGTMKITGLEITVESSDNDITKVTTTGTPAHFQQQPAADQAVAHISGDTLVFDNAKQLVTADGNAQYTQAGRELSGNHLEYNIQSRTATAAARDGELVNMFIPPAPDKSAPAETAPEAPAATEE